MTTITGNTYPVRDQIKPFGFKWNKHRKSWERPLPLTPDEETTLGAIKGIFIMSMGNVDTIIDNRPYKERYGRCEDAPCCGCCGPQFY